MSELVRGRRFKRTRHSGRRVPAATKSAHSAASARSPLEYKFATLSPPRRCHPFLKLAAETWLEDLTRVCCLPSLYQHFELLEFVVYDRLGFEFSLAIEVFKRTKENPIYWKVMSYWKRIRIFLLSNKSFQKGCEILLIKETKKKQLF